MSRGHKGEEGAIETEPSVSIVVYFTRRQLKQFAAELAEPIEPEVASLAFSVLEKNAQDLGLTLICPLTTCRGRLCQAPHRLGAPNLEAWDQELLASIKGGGNSLAVLQLKFRDHLHEQGRA